MQRRAGIQARLFFEHLDEYGKRAKTSAKIQQGIGRFVSRGHIPARMKSCSRKNI
jgi:hypothetical protein